MACSSSVLMYCNMSCAGEECSFLCSGKNWEMFAKHAKECRYIREKCSNEPCTLMVERYLMEYHFTVCDYAIEICPNGNCSLEMQRREMNSHLQKCPYQMVSCKNKPFGCSPIMARKDLEKHLKECPLTPTPCERCGEPKRSSFKHICPFDTEICPHCNKEFIIKNFDLHQNSCLTKCKLCEKYFPNSEIRHHKCPIKKCGYQFCEYKDLPLKVELHMSECGYRLITCSLCQENVLSKNLKLHTSKCEKRVRCRRCNLNIDISTKDVHDMLDGIANLSLTTCPTCREEVQSGLTNSQKDRNPQDENHKTDEVFSAYDVNNDQQRQKMNDGYSKKSSSNENVVSDLNFKLGYDLVHNVNDYKKYTEETVMELHFPSHSSCSESRDRLRRYMEEIGKNNILKQKVRDNNYSILNFRLT